MSIAQSRPETTRVGGVTGKGFTPGVSGNPGGLSPERSLEDYLSRFSLGDLEAMKAILQKYSPELADRTEAGACQLGAGSFGVSSRQR